MDRDHAYRDYPFADGHNVLWELEGYGSDDRQHSSRLLGREEYCASGTSSRPNSATTTG
ncbi:hypothetical protein [Kitasatospora aureofaciens]